MRDFLKSKGYDGVEYLNTYEVEEETAYIAFSSSQIKSADPVTYDDDGNVIPLSQRFNEENDDIRYSDRDSDGNILTAEQIEFFKNSKVRWGGKLMPVYHGTREDFTVFKSVVHNGLMWASKDVEYARG